jgi:hypothetical protein
MTFTFYHKKNRKQLSKHVSTVKEIITSDGSIKAAIILVG